MSTTTAHRHRLRQSEALPLAVPEVPPATAERGITRRHLLALLPGGPAHALIGVAAGAGLLAVSGCGALPSARSIVLSEADLRRGLLARFPASQRVLGLLDFSFGEPVLQLLPGENRLALAVDARGRDRLVGHSIGAELGFTARLRWQASDASLQLADVRVERLRLRQATGAARVEAQAAQSAQAAAEGGASAASLTSMERIARYVAEEALEGLVVYRLSPERQTQLRERGLAVGTLTVVAGGLRIDLVPAS